MPDAKLRAWWSHLQGLDAQSAGGYAGETAHSVLAQTGWARSLAGVGPYLTLYSRAAIGRESVDQAMRDLEIHELPSARGCTYVVPAADFALALKVGQNFDNEIKTAEKLGVKRGEIEKLCAAILSALAKEELDPNGLREALGSAVRDLGEAGKKKGLASTLPVALGNLQTGGEIRRVPVNGRLDQQRYRYTLWRPNPLVKFKLTLEESYIELARRFFSWIGPATMAEFQWFSGLGVKAAKAAVEPLGLEPISTEEGRLLLPQHRERWEKFRAPKAPQYTLVSSVDAIILLRRDVKSLLAPEDCKRKVPVEKGVAEIGSLTDLPSHAILDRGRLVGLWLYDTTAESIAWMSFVSRDALLKKTVNRVQDYIRNEVGDARSFSLDSPQSRAPRVAALRKAGA